MADEPILNVKIAKQELLRLGQAILAVVLILIGGLIAINQWLIEPRSFGDLQTVVSDRATGRPSAGVLMELFDASSSLLATGHSDENGYYEQGRMPEGKYRIRVSVPGYHPVVREFEVLAGEATRLMLVLVPEAPRSAAPVSRPAPPVEPSAPAEAPQPPPPAPEPEAQTSGEPPAG